MGNYGIFHHLRTGSDPTRIDRIGVDLIAPQMVTRKGFPNSSQDKNVDISRFRVNISLYLVFRNYLEVSRGSTWHRAPAVRSYVCSPLSGNSYLFLWSFENYMFQL